MMGWYLYEIAITGVMDNLFLCFCMIVFYFMGKMWLYPSIKIILSDLKSLIKISLGLIKRVEKVIEFQKLEQNARAKKIIEEIENR